MKNAFKTVSLLVVPLAVAGCKAPSTTGLSEVQNTIQSRTGQQLGWPGTAQQSQQMEETIRAVLRENLTAEGAVQIALLNNRSLRATLAEVGISEADLWQASLLRNPQFSGHIRFPDRPPSAANTEFGLAEDFLDVLLRPLRKKVAAIQLEQTKLRVSHQVLQLVADVKRTFYTVQARQQLAKRLKDIVELNEATVELSLRQRQAGNITDLALANQEAAFQQAKLEWARTEAELRVNRERLNRVLGLWGTNTAWKVTNELPALPDREIPLENLESLALERRLDLGAVRQQATLVANTLRLRTRNRYLPSAKIGIDSERDPDRQTVTGPSFDLELPIFDQGQAAVAKLQRQYQQAQWRAESLATDIRSEVRQARDTLVAARDLTEFYSRIYLPQRMRVVNESLLQYNAMQTGAFELATARQNELLAERDYVEAWRDYWIARSELEKAVGTRLAEEPTPSVHNPQQEPAAPIQPNHEHHHN